MIATNLPYLNAAMKETLRLYPILPFIDRVCAINGKGYSLEPYSSFKIPNGMPVYIPIYNLQRDAEVKFVVGALICVTKIVNRILLVFPRTRKVYS